ncbi:MAG: hypothetical protein ABIA04_00885 [Pseudomonadota bacterium]
MTLMNLKKIFNLNIISLICFCFLLEASPANENCFERFFKILASEDSKSVELIKEYESILKECNESELLPLVRQRLAYFYEIVGKDKEALHLYSQKSNFYSNDLLELGNLIGIKRTKSKLGNKSSLAETFPDERAFSDARAAVKNQDPHAKKMTLDFLKKYPKSTRVPMANLMLGLLAKQRRNFEETLLYLKKAMQDKEVRDDEGYKIALIAAYEQGNAYLTLDRLDEAKAQYAFILKTFPNDNMPYGGEVFNAKYRMLYKVAALRNLNSYSDFISSRAMFYNALSGKNKKDVSEEIKSFREVDTKFTNTNYGGLALFQEALLYLAEADPEQKKRGLGKLGKVIEKYYWSRTEQGMSLGLLAKALLAEHYYNHGDCKNAEYYSKQVEHNSEIIDYKSLSEEIQFSHPDYERILFISQQCKPRSRR